MDNMFDTIKWSTSWDSPMGGPQMINGVGWDYSSMQHWAGMPHADDYFDVGFTEDPSQALPGFDLDNTMHTSDPGDLMRGQYGLGHMEQRHSL